MAADYGIGNAIVFQSSSGAEQAITDGLNRLRHSIENVWAEQNHVRLRHRTKPLHDDHAVAYTRSAAATPAPGETFAPWPVRHCSSAARNCSTTPGRLL